MSIGYDKPLYVLPFYHRGTYRAWVDLFEKAK